MFAKPKFPVFIDTVEFEFLDQFSNNFRAVLKDEYGSICVRLDADVPSGLKSYKWRGLDSLPYGVYTLEYSSGLEEHSQRMVKRI